MKTKILHQLAAGVGISALFLACGGNSTGQDTTARHLPPVTGMVVEQLEASRQNLIAKGPPLHIVSYAATDPLDTERSVRAAEVQIVDGDAVVPQYNGMDASSFELHTIHERMQAYQSGAEKRDVVANIKAMALPSLKPGQKVADVTWESQGREFHSKCVYDDNGVVYDNLLSNLAFVEVKEQPLDQPYPIEKGVVSQIVGNGPHHEALIANSVRFLDLKITWAWGSTRGKVEITHTAFTNNAATAFVDQSGTVNAWMSVGSAEGQTRAHSMSSKLAKLAWGYGWATPTADFNISWNPGDATFTVGLSGVGSKGKGSGIHTYYIP